MAFLRESGRNNHLQRRLGEATTDQLLRAILPRGTSFKRLQTDWRKAKGPGQIAYRYCSAVTRDGWPCIVDAHRDGKRFIR